MADLEQRLANARAQGISATTQVQLAARKVVDENGRLRGLLRLAGFADEEIDVWAESADGTDCARRGEIKQKAKLCAATVAASPQGLAAQGQKKSSSWKKTTGNGVASAGILPASTDPLPSTPSSQSPSSSAETAVCSTETEPCDRGTRPCQLLSLLAENPAADITQVVTAGPGPEDQGTADREGDVECGKAYQMLMRYATSEEKMDYVARALEAGCTSTGQGGCAVKKQAIWEALDNMCG